MHTKLQASMSPESQENENSGSGGFGRWQEDVPTEQDQEPEVLRSLFHTIGEFYTFVRADMAKKNHECTVAF